MIEPGQTCTTCNRRVPHPRTEHSPVSKTFSVKLPADDHDSLRQLVDDLATGPFAAHKYPRAAAVEAGLVLLTQLDATVLQAIADEKRGAE